MHGVKSTVSLIRTVISDQYPCSSSSSKLLLLLKVQGWPGYSSSSLTYIAIVRIYTLPIVVQFIILAHPVCAVISRTMVSWSECELTRYYNLYPLLGQWIQPLHPPTSGYTPWRLYLIYDNEAFTLISAVIFRPIPSNKEVTTNVLRHNNLITNIFYILF